MKHGIVQLISAIMRDKKNGHTCLDFAFSPAALEPASFSLSWILTGRNTAE